MKTQRDQWLLFWLLSTCFLVWLMIMLGGATRLTHSGLSIVEWRPVTGIIPPLNKLAWQAEFQKYQQFPEFQQLNSTMTLEGFKYIYGMEYAHRLLGRVIGLWFLLPLLAFWNYGWLTPRLKRRSLIVLGIGLLQGVMGWYMVQSGLVKNPQVSHYRLTIHLLLAVSLYGMLLWTAFQLQWPGKWRWRGWPLLTCGSIFLTLIYGGLVAGLKAGLVYNTFPLMNGRLIAEDSLFLVPWWRNFLENAATVQFIHRWLGIATLGVIFIAMWQNRQLSNIVISLALLASLQVLLGIATLLLQVPVVLGILHQGTAILVVSVALAFAYHSGYQESQKTR